MAHNFAKPRLLSRGFMVVLLSGGVCPGPAAMAESATTPSGWTSYAMNGRHEAVYTSSFPARSWTYGVPGVDRMDHAIIRTGTQIRNYAGFPIGVSVVDGVVYAPNDNGYLYALDLQSGRLLWKKNFYNQIMTTPIVATIDGSLLVFIGVGNSVFSYSHAASFGEAGKAVIRGNGVSGIAAVKASNGTLQWFHPTRAEDMPTAAFVDGHLIFGNGSGHIRALDPATGQGLWKQSIMSFVSMSSATPALRGSIVLMGGTHPSRLYAVDSATGRILWAVHPAHVFSSSAGDGTLAASGHYAVAQIEVRRPGMPTGQSESEELALDVHSGKILWTRILGQGKVPPRNKDAVPLIAGGSVYTGSPVTHEEYRIDLHSGRVLWSVRMSGGMKGAPDLYRSDLIQALGSGEIVTLDAATGRIVHSYHYPHGGFGPQDGVIIGQTYLIGSNAGYLSAIPVRNLL